MDPLILLILGFLIFGGAIGLFLALILGALLIYNVKNIYPLIRTIALWAAEFRNFISFLALEALLLFLMVSSFVAIRNVIGILVVLLLLLPLMVAGMLLGLALLVYVLGIIGWLYRLWRTIITGLWIGFLPQLKKIQLKHDVGKDKDWKTKLDEMRGKLSGEAQQARDRISKRLK